MMNITDNNSTRITGLRNGILHNSSILSLLDSLTGLNLIESSVQSAVFAKIAHQSVNLISTLLPDTPVTS